MLVLVAYLVQWTVWFRQANRPAPWELSISTPIRTDSNAAILPYCTNALKPKPHGKLPCLSICLFIVLTDHYSEI